MQFNRHSNQTTRGIKPKQPFANPKNENKKMFQASKVPNAARSPLPPHKPGFHAFSIWKMIAPQHKPLPGIEKASLPPNSVMPFFHKFLKTQNSHHGNQMVTIVIDSSCLGGNLSFSKHLTEPMKTFKHKINMSVQPWNVLLETTSPARQSKLP